MAAFAKNWGTRIASLTVKTGKWGQYYGQKLAIVAPGNEKFCLPFNHNHSFFFWLLNVQKFKPLCLERANTFWSYAKIELAPPSIADFAVARKQINEGVNSFLSGQAFQTSTKVISDYFAHCSDH